MAGHTPLALLAAAALCILAVSVADNATVSHRHLIVIGRCRDHATLLYQRTVSKGARSDEKRVVIVEYPESGHRGHRIGCVRLRSLKSGDHQGRVRLLDGGPRRHHVSIKVSSDRGHSMAWDVRIYGRG